MAQGYGHPSASYDKIPHERTTTQEDIDREIAEGTNPFAALGKPGTYVHHEYKPVPRTNFGVVLHGVRDKSNELEFGGLRNKQLDPGWGPVPWGESEIPLDPDGHVQVTGMSLMLPHHDGHVHVPISFTAPATGSRLIDQDWQPPLT